MTAGDWVTAQGKGLHPDLAVMAEAKEIVCRERRTIEGIRVLFERGGRPVMEFGTFSRVRVTAAVGHAEIWNASVESPYAISLKYDQLFSPHAELDPECGLPKTRIFPPYLRLERRKFSFWTASPHKFIAIAWQIGQALR
jgi:hypothetical protein